MLIETISLTRLKNLVLVFVALILSSSIRAQEPVEYNKKNKIIVAPGDTVYEYNSGKKPDATEKIQVEKQQQQELAKNDNGNFQQKRIIPIEYFSSRYAFSPSGFGLKKGEGYYEWSEILMNSVYCGLTDHISIGGGCIFIVPAFLSARVTFPFSDYLQLGIGYLIVNPVVASSGAPLQVAYASFTFGTRSANISLNYGGNLDAINKLPIYTLNGFLKVSDHFGFVTENWIFNINRDNLHSFNIYSMGFRAMSGNRAFDFGIMNFHSVNEFNQSLFFPYFSMSVPLYSRKKYVN